MSLACRHNDKTVELTGHTGHFWLDFDKADDAQEWWTAMQSLNIAKNRSSFIPYVATDNTEQKSKLHFFMNRIFGGQIDFLTPFNPRAQTVRVNPESWSPDYHGHTEIFYRAKSSNFSNFSGRNWWQTTPFNH